MEELYGTLTISLVVSYRPVESRKTTQKMVMERFVGVTREQARGILANFKGMNPDLHQSLEWVWAAEDFLLE